MLLNVRAAATYELAARKLHLPDGRAVAHRSDTSCPGRATGDDAHAFLRAEARPLRESSRSSWAARGRSSSSSTQRSRPLPTPARSEATEQIPRTIAARGHDLHAAVALLPVGPAGPDGQAEFGHVSPGGSRVLAISQWVRQHVDYVYGTTDSRTSAFDTATERVGVCRDFAHLVIAFCRGLDIPARYVSGYALGLGPRTSTATHRSIWEERGTILTRRPRRSGPPWCRFAWDETPPTSPSPPSGASARWSNRPCWCTRLEHEWPRDLSEGHGPERRNNSSIKPDVLQSSLRPI